jgi:hypothetical protein
METGFTFKAETEWGLRLSMQSPYRQPFRIT